LEIARSGGTKELSFIEELLIFSNLAVIYAKLGGGFAIF
jgi:hypothetical protein